MVSIMVSLMLIAAGMSLLSLLFVSSYHLSRKIAYKLYDKSWTRAYAGDAVYFVINSVITIPYLLGALSYHAYHQMSLNTALIFIAIIFTRYWEAGRLIQESNMTHDFKIEQSTKVLDIAANLAVIGHVIILLAA